MNIYCRKEPQNNSDSIDRFIRIAASIERLSIFGGGGAKRESKLGLLILCVFCNLV